MTDRYAVKCFNDLFVPKSWLIKKALYKVFYGEVDKMSVSDEFCGVKVQN
jgi:hypothetical protein